MQENPQGGPFVCQKPLTWGNFMSLPLSPPFDFLFLIDQSISGYVGKKGKARAMKTEFQVWIHAFPLSQEGSASVNAHPG